MLFTVHDTLTARVWTVMFTVHITLTTRVSTVLFRVCVTLTTRVWTVLFTVYVTLTTRVWTVLFTVYVTLTTRVVYSLGKDYKALACLGELMLNPSVKQLETVSDGLKSFFTSDIRALILSCRLAIVFQTDLKFSICSITGWWMTQLKSNRGFPTQNDEWRN